MARIVNLLSSDILSSRIGVAEWLERRTDYALFLDFPQECHKIFAEIARGLSIGRAIELLRKEGTLRDPEDVRHYRSSRPILELLPRIGKGVRALCYLSQMRNLISAETAREIFILTFRARMGVIDPARWKQLIEEEVRAVIPYCRDEAQVILREAGDYGVCLNVPEEVEAILKEKGYALERVEIDGILRPIDILTMKVKKEVLHGETVSLGEVLSLVRMHAEFAEVAMKQGFELACELFSSRLSQGRHYS